MAIEDAEDLERARNRVLLVSILYGILVIATGVGGWALQTVFLQDLVEHIHQLADTNGVSPSLSQVQVPDSSGLSGAANSALLILVGLSIPLCGYTGAKWKQKECLKAFCGCSCMSCLCNFFTLLVLMLYLSLITILDSGTASIQQCDPYNLCPKESGLWNTERVVDCLARSTWPSQYTPLYPDYGQQNPPKCYLSVLDCGADPGRTRSGGVQTPTQAPAPSPPPMPAPGPKALDAALDAMEAGPLMQDDRDDDFDVPLPSAEDAPSGLDRLRKPRSSVDRLRRLLAKVPAIPDAEWSMKVASAVAGGDAGSETKMPMDPLSQCKANAMRIEMTHGMVAWLTSSLPRFRTFTQSLVAVTLLATVLSCFSFWWGKELHDAVTAEPAFQPLEPPRTETRSRHAQPQGRFTGH